MHRMFDIQESHSRLPYPHPWLFRTSYLTLATHKLCNIQGIKGDPGLEIATTHGTLLQVDRSTQGILNHVALERNNPGRQCVLRITMFCPTVTKERVHGTRAWVPLRFRPCILWSILFYEVHIPYSEAADLREMEKVKPDGIRSCAGTKGGTSLLSRASANLFHCHLHPLFLARRKSKKTSTCCGRLQVERYAGRLFRLKLGRYVCDSKPALHLSVSIHRKKVTPVTLQQVHTQREWVPTVSHPHKIRKCRVLSKKKESKNHKNKYQVKTQYQISPQKFHNCPFGDMETRLTAKRNQKKRDKKVFDIEFPSSTSKQASSSIWNRQTSGY